MNQDWPRRVGSSCFALHIRRAARQINRLFDEALKPAGLTNGQFSLMTMLAVLEDCPLGEVAERLGLDRTTLYATLKPLERDGLVRSQPDPGDARVRRLALTTEGQRRLEVAEPLWADAQAKVTKMVGDDQAETLRSYLRKIA